MADVLISKSRSGQFIQGVKAPSTPSFVNGENPVPVDSGGDAGGGSFVPQTRELTINGTVFDLSQDREWTIPTHDAVSIGTSNGLSLSGQELSLGLASATTTGAVSSTDWNAFNNKVSSQWGTNGTSIFYNGGNVGIGVNNPLLRLDINGGLRLTTVAGIDSGILLRNGTSTSTIRNPNANTRDIQFDQTTEGTFLFKQDGSLLINQIVSTGERLQVNGDIRINQNFGLMLIAPNGSRYRVTVNNSGTLVTTLV